MKKSSSSPPGVESLRVLFSQFSAFSEFTWEAAVVWPVVDRCPGQAVCQHWTGWTGWTQQSEESSLRSVKTFDYHSCDKLSQWDLTIFKSHLKESFQIPASLAWPFMELFVHIFSVHSSGIFMLWRQHATSQPTTQKQLHVANNISCVFWKVQTTQLLSWSRVSQLIAGHVSVHCPASVASPHLTTLYLHILMIWKLSVPAGQPWTFFQLKSPRTIEQQIKSKHLALASRSS